MNAAAKELPVSYDLSKPQEDREPYVGSVLFFKHVIFTVTLLLILIPTTLSIYLFAQVRSLNRQLDAAGSQLAAMQEQLPSTAPEGGEPTPVEPEPPAAEAPAYTELYPELYADDSLRGTVDVDNAVYLTFDDGPSARTDEILNHVAKTVQRTGIVVHQKIDRRFIDQLSLEIDDGHHDRILAQIDDDEIPGIGIQAVDIRPSAAGRPLLAEIMDEAFVDQLPDQFGYGRHAQIHGLAQIGDARIPAKDILANDLLFENRILVAFRRLF